METKQRVRREYLALRKSLAAETVRLCSEEICRRLLYSAAYKNSGKIFAYAACNNEADLTVLVQKALSDGKEVYFPKVIGAELEFYRIKSMRELSEGCFHILEPTDFQNPFAITAEEKEPLFILTPGVAFAENGARIGYGKGFYDRFFRRLQENHVIFTPVGISFEMQLLDEFEPEAFDCRMEKIFTEKREVVCNG